MTEETTKEETIPVELLYPWKSHLAGAVLDLPYQGAYNLCTQRRKPAGRRGPVGDKLAKYAGKGDAPWDREKKEVDADRSAPGSAPLEDQSVDELKAAAKARGLKVGGTKEELIERLTE